MFNNIVYAICNYSNKDCYTFSNIVPFMVDRNTSCDRFRKQLLDLCQRKKHRDKTFEGSCQLFPMGDNVSKYRNDI